MSLARLANALTMRLGRGDPARLLAFIRHLPMPLVRQLRGAALRRTVRLAARQSEFYRQRFSALGLRPERVRNLKDLASCVTTPEDLRSMPAEALVCHRPELAVESSGTTGRVTTVYLDHAELEYEARQVIVFLAIIGVTPDDRILGAFDYAWGLGGLYTQRIAANSGLFGLCPGLIDPGEAVERLDRYRFTVIIADPFWLSRFTEVAETRGVRRRLTALISGAERMTESLRRQLQDYWQAPLYMTYGSTELGACVGMECPAQEGYHLNEYDYAVELANPDSDGYGEIVFTTLTRRVMPLIRYHTHDVARWIPGPCACGWPFRRISALRGRNDEVIACVWGDVHPDFFEKLLSAIPGITDEWQVALQQRGLRPTFEFRLVARAPSLSPQAVDTELRRRLAGDHPALWAKVQQCMSDLEVRLVDREQIRTGRKIRRLVDERDDVRRSAGR